MRFDPAEALLPEVDLISEFKGIGNVIVNKTAKVYDNLPEPRQKCLTGMHDARARDPLISGVARSGKYFLVESLMPFTIFGSGIEQPHKLKVLYIMNNNVGIETICQRLPRTFRDWGFTDEQLNEVLNSTHLYPLDGEVRSAVTEAQRQDQPQDDAETADLADEVVTSEVIRSLYKNVFDAKEALVKSKNANREKSLHEIALRLLAQNQNPEQYCELKKLLASVADDTRRRILRLLGKLAPKIISDEIIRLLYVSLD